MDLELDDHFVANFLNRDTSNSNLTDGPENSDAIIERNRRSLATTITHTQDTVNKGIDLIDSFETQSLDLNKGQDDADFQVGDQIRDHLNDATKCRIIMKSIFSKSKWNEMNQIGKLNLQHKILMN